MGSDDLPLRVENQPMNPTAPQLATAIAPGPGMAPGGAFAKDNHAEHLVLGHVPDAAGADDLAVLHHRHAVGEVEHVVDVLTDEEDAEALGLELLDELANLRGLGRPQRRRRLMRPTEALRGCAWRCFEHSKPLESAELNQANEAPLRP